METLQSSQPQQVTNTIETAESTTQNDKMTSQPGRSEQLNHDFQKENDKSYAQQDLVMSKGTTTTTDNPSTDFILQNNSDILPNCFIEQEDSLKQELLDNVSSLVTDTQIIESIVKTEEGKEEPTEEGGSSFEKEISSDTITDEMIRAVDIENVGSDGMQQAIGSNEDSVDTAVANHGDQDPLVKEEGIGDSNADPEEINGTMVHLGGHGNFGSDPLTMDKHDGSNGVKLEQEGTIGQEGNKDTHQDVVPSLVVHGEEENGRNVPFENEHEIPLQDSLQATQQQEQQEEQNQQTQLGTNESSDQCQQTLESQVDSEGLEGIDKVTHDKPKGNNVIMEPTDDVTTASDDTPRATIAQIISTPAASTTPSATTTLLDESILVELQASLQHQMTIRAEVEDKLRQQAGEIDSYKKKLEEYSTLEDELEKVNATLTQSIAEKTALEQEVMKLREGRDDLERREAVLSNRLNDAKKKEANVSHVAGRLEAENEELKKALESSQEELKVVVAQKQKLENSMEKLKKKCVERVKMSEAALVEERNLNEERKKKMKVFVETKAEELRSAKTTADELRAELKETSEALESVRGKLERMMQQYENTSMKNRELTREINRMKKNSEQLHQLGGSLEMELQKSAQETEEHKNKRLTAKHELMTILRKLEAEQAVSGKLRDSVKFTFTPKALSQQQLLQEGLEDFESELLKLSRRLGKPLPPSTYSNGQIPIEVNSENNVGQKDSDDHQSLDHAEKKKMNSRSEWDAARLLSSLEHETQQVSKGIMAFTNAVERLHILLDTSGEKTCVNTLNEIFGVLASARGDVRPITSSTVTATAPVGHIASFEDEDGSFSGSPVNKKRSSERYGLVEPGS